MNKDGEQLRVELAVQTTLNDASDRFRCVTGKDLVALQQELLEWLSDDIQAKNVMHLDHYSYW